VATIRADEEMAEAARVMISEQIRHLPVVENEQLLGVLSIRNIVQWSVRQSPDEGRHLPQLMDLV
jgi:predicted transcriptional regulator